MLARQADAKKTKDAGTSSPDRVVNWIVDGLHSGRYVPGQQLVEADLIATLGISRGPVREGLKRLHGRGIVRQIPYRGAHIRAFTRSEARDLLIVLEPLTSLMVSLAAAAVKAGMSAKSLTEIQQWIQSFQRGDINEVTFAGKRQHLYQVLMEIGGNVELPEIMPAYLLHLLRLQSFPYLDIRQRQSVVDEYARIIDAVFAGDAVQGAKVGRAHVQAAQKRLASLPDEAFPDFRYES